MSEAQRVGSTSSAARRDATPTYTTRRRLLLGCLVAAYCFGNGAAVGVLIERVRFDGRRAAVLAQYEALSARLRDRLMAIEKPVPRPAPAER